MKKTNKYSLEIDEIYFVYEGSVNWLVKIVNPERPKGYDESDGDICTAKIVQTSGSYIILHPEASSIILYFTPKSRKFRKASKSEVLWFDRAVKDSTIASKGYFSYLGWFLKNKFWDEKRI